jgi:hypothetical protein
MNVDSMLKTLGELGSQELRTNKLLAFCASRGFLRGELLPEGQAQLLENARREVYLRSMVKEIVKAAAGRGIEPVALKGLALWGEIYRPGEREVNDIDLLVQPNEFEPFLSVLADLGYAVPEIERSPLYGFKANCFREDSGDYPIEVHAKLWWKEPRGFQWQRRSEGVLAKLSLEDQLIHLCGHWIAQHTMISLHWLIDIALFCGHYDERIDWAKVQQRAKILRLEKSVAFAIFLIHELFHMKLKVGGLNWQDASRSLRDSVDLRYLSGEDAGRWAWQWRYYWLKHRVQDRMRDAVAYDLVWLMSKMGS